MDQLLSPDDLKDALIMDANWMASSYIENLGNNKFTMKPLPVVAQSAPVNGIITTDANGDGNLDVMMVGNDYGNEVFAGRYDAFTGLVLLGDGTGAFQVMPSAKSGFYVAGDAKSLARLYGANGEELFIATQNKDSVEVFAKKPFDNVKVINVNPLASHADIFYQDGRKQKVEFYYGSGYLSQSSRKLVVPNNVKEIVIYDYAGKSTKLSPEGI
jgi:hypothetical protein